MHLFGSFFVLALVFCASPAQSMSHILRQTHNLHRAHGQQNTTSMVELATRAEVYANARFSWFVTGLGACGKYNSPSDFIVALSVPFFGKGEHCGETITITVGGKTAQATVADMCQECPPTAVDLTKGLFDYFGGDGYIYGSWHYGAGSTDPPPVTTTEKPKTTTLPPPPPPPSTTSSTTTRQKPTTTSTPPPPPPPTSTSSTLPSTSRALSVPTTSSIVTSASSASLSSSTSPTSSMSSSTPSAASTNSLFGAVNQIILQFGTLAAFAAQDSPASGS